MSDDALFEQVGEAVARSYLKIQGAAHRKGLPTHYAAALWLIASMQDKGASRLWMRASLMGGGEQYYVTVRRRNWRDAVKEAVVTAFWDGGA